MATIDDIKNSALILIGSQKVTDFTSTTDNKVITCNDLYPLVKERILSMNRWAFARKRASAGTATAVTNDKYTYSYAIPSDFLQMISPYADDKYTNPYGNYEILVDKIYTDISSLYLYYTYNVDEDDFSGYFKDFFRYAFASEICWKLTGDKVLYDYLIERAYGGPQSNNQGGLYGLACRIDGQQNPPKIINDSPILASRFSGVGVRAQRR